MNVRIVKGKLVLPIAIGCKNLTESKYHLFLTVGDLIAHFNCSIKCLKDAMLVFQPLYAFHVLPFREPRPFH